MHRYYDPDTGRYLTPDPIGLAGGINPFVYVLNDPVNWVDPLGLDKLLGGYGLTRYSTRYSRIWGRLGRWTGGAVSGEILGKLGIPSAGVFGFGGPLIGGVGYVLLSPDELGDGTLPDKNGNGVPDILENFPLYLPNDESSTHCE